MENGPSKRVAERYAFSKEAMATVLRQVAKRDWGFYTREEERMHLQTVDGDDEKAKAKVWLEAKGKRIFEIAVGKKTFSPKDFAKLEAKVRSDRESVEMRWIRLMIGKDWLTADLYGSDVLVTAYPGTHNSFERIVDLKQEFPGFYSSRVHPRWDDLDIKATFLAQPVALAVGPEDRPEDREYIKITDFLFED